MKKQFLTFTVAMAVLCSGVCAIYADEINCPKKLTPEQRKEIVKKHIDKFEATLNLSDEQKVLAKEIKKTSHQKMKPLFEKKMAKLKEITEIRENDNISIKVQDKKIEAIKADLKVIDQEIRQVKQDERKAFKAILTDEQKQKLEEMKLQKHQKPHRKHKPHHKK